MIWFKSFFFFGGGGLIGIIILIVGLMSYLNNKFCVEPHGTDVAVSFSCKALQFV